MNKSQNIRTDITFFVISESRYMEKIFAEVSLGNGTRAGSAELFSWGNTRHVCEACRKRFSSLYIQRGDACRRGYSSKCRGTKSVIPGFSDNLAGQLGKAGACAQKKQKTGKFCAAREWKSSRTRRESRNRDHSCNDDFLAMAGQDWTNTVFGQEEDGKRVTNKKDIYECIC